MINKTMMAVLACALMAGSLPARAQAVTSDERAGTVQETVHLGDINLASRSGQAAARLRLLGAGQAVCGSIYPDTGTQTALNDECRSEALSDARAQLVRLTLQARGDRIELARQ